MSALALAVAVLALLALAPLAQASKGVVSWIGATSSGTLGAQFNAPRGVAVNSSGVGATAGDIYVVDSTNNRIQQFHADSSFVRAWGYDVIQSGKPGDNDSLQALTVSAGAGQFRLTFNGQTTGDLAFGATAAQVQTALQNLSSIGVGNVAVSGGPGDAAGSRPYMIDLTGALGGAAQPTITTSNGTTPLSGGSSSATIAVLNPGGVTGFEVCTVAANCKAGITTVSPAAGGELSSPQGIAVDQSTGSVYVSDQGFLRVQKFSAAGVFQAAFGQDVVNAGTGNNPAAAAKQTLTVDATAGQFKLTFKGQTTADIAFNAPATGAGSVQTALQALSTIGASNATVTGSAGGPYTIAFAAALTNSPQPLITTSNGTTPLSGGTTSTATVTNNTTGSSGFEVCTAASASCKTGVTGATAGAFATTFAGHLAVAPAGSPNAGDVIVADPANRRVQEFTSVGAFVRAFGFDVAASPTGSGTSFEVCSAANFDVCKIAATTGSGNGQFTTNQPTRVAEDSTGAIYTVESATANFRVQKFTLPANVVTPQGAFASATLTGTAVSNTPTDIAIGPSDHVFVVKAFPAATGTPPATAAERRVLELDSTGALVDTHMALAAINTVNGLGLNTANGRIQVSSTTKGHRVYALDNPLPNPALALNPITTKTDTTATFSGTVDPMGGQLSCTYQYSTDQSTWTDVPEPDCAGLVNGGGAQAISESVTGLTPNTHYYVRLSASRPFPPTTTTTTAGVQPFDTDSVSPVITDVGAIQVGDGSARLVGTIDPRNSATGYVFQYGLTPALGSSTAPVNIGGGATPITVSQVIDGLDKDTDYYFRVVATNLTGTTASASKTFHTRAVPFPPAGPGNCPNEAIRTAQGSTYLPDCRAYEMVSPPEKNQGGVDQGVQDSNPAFAADGDSAAFCTTAVFGDPPAQQSTGCATYISHRTGGPEPTGWQTSSPFPRYCRNDRQDGVGNGTQSFYLSLNIDRIFLTNTDLASCPFGAPLVAGAPMPARNLYREDLDAHPADFKLLAPNPLDPLVPTTEQATGEFAGASPDFSHIVYWSTANQTADSPSPGNFNKLYDWQQPGPGCGPANADWKPTLGACLSLISRDTNNVPLTTDSALPTFLSGGVGQPEPSGVSADGSRIYFSNPAPGGSLANTSCTGAVDCELYMRENDAVTYDVSASECTVSCDPTSHSGDVFESATPSGAAAFFLSCDKLTNASTAFQTPSGDCDDNSQHIVEEYALHPDQAKLYRWDRNGASGHQLIDLSVDNEPADGSMPKVKGLLGISSDAAAPPGDNAAPGNTAYFVARGQIVSGEPGKDGLKLYRWIYNAGDPKVEYLGPYVSSVPDGTEASLNDPLIASLSADPNVNRQHVNVTPDGKYLAISSKYPYDPAADRDQDTDLYRWDQTAGWTCVSCQLPGKPSAGGANSVYLYPSWNGELFPTASIHQRENLVSPDGQRIVFTTPDALVPEDVNGEAGCPATHSPSLPVITYACQDIYEWHDGTLSLLTPGTESEPPKLMGATAGGDVFFETRQRLVGWDNDNGTDIYTARIGGGFSEPPPQPSACDLNAGACEGPGTVAPATTGAGTAVFQGQDNPPIKRHPVRKHHKHKKRHHKRHQARAHHRAANHDRRTAR